MGSDYNYPQTFTTARQLNSVNVRAYRFLIVISCLFIGTSGCFEGAPRRHPLDPLSENFIDEGTITARVTSFYAPQTALEDVEITVTPGGLTGKTDASGLISFPGLPSGSYTVSISKPDFASFTDTVVVSPGEITQLEMGLAGLPTFTRFEIGSVHIRRWFPPPEELFMIDVLAEVDDSDGLADIDSVSVVIPDFGFSVPLSIQSEPGLFRQTLSSEQLPVNLQSLYGRSFYLEATDRAGFSNSSPPKTLIRVIEETPLALEPQGLVLLNDPTPTFTWEAITLSFPFTFRLDIVRVDDNVENTVQSIENLSSSLTSTDAMAPLPTGRYFWTISIVDEFGNRSQSREAGFRIP